MWVCRLPVHIGPADYTVFTGIFGEFVTSQWADVGIGPYRVSANSYCFANFDRKTFLPRQPYPASLFSPFFSGKAEKNGPPEA